MDAGKDAAMAFGRGEGMNKMRCYAMQCGLVEGGNIFYIIVRGTVRCDKHIKAAVPVASKSAVVEYHGGIFLAGQ